jgi:hypothetical protein
MDTRDLIEAPDSSDADALESLAISEGWQLIGERVWDVIENKRDELERSGDKADEHRGFLAACRMFLALPGNMAGEIKSQGVNR